MEYFIASEIQPWSPYVEFVIRSICNGRNHLNSIFKYWLVPSVIVYLYIIYVFVWCKYQYHVDCCPYVVHIWHVMTMYRIYKRFIEDWLEGCWRFCIIKLLYWHRKVIKDLQMLNVEMLILDYRGEGGSKMGRKLY